jgi:hypothetical protein
MPAMAGAVGSGPGSIGGNGGGSGGSARKGSTAEYDSNGQYGAYGNSSSYAAKSSNNNAVTSNNSGRPKIRRMRDLNTVAIPTRTYLEAGSASSLAEPRCSRIGPQFQVADLPAAAGLAYAPEPSRATLMWSPDSVDMEAGKLKDFVHFARMFGSRDTDRGLSPPNKDVEFAHHILYVASQDHTSEKPLITRALTILTDTKTPLPARLTEYTYEGGATWSDAERSAFLQGLEDYGKNFSYIQRTITTKTCAEIVEFYYVFKTCWQDEYLRIKTVIKQRALDEQRRGEKEGFVSSCDSCGVTHSPRWRRSPNTAQDWCERCYNLATHGSEFRPASCNGQAGSPPLRTVADTIGSASSAAGTTTTATASAFTTSATTSFAVAGKKSSPPPPAAPRPRPKPHTGGPFICEICGKGFSVPNSLFGHMRVHGMAARVAEMRRIQSSRVLMQAAVGI